MLGLSGWGAVWQPGTNGSISQTQNILANDALQDASGNIVMGTITIADTTFTDNVAGGKLMVPNPVEPVSWGKAEEERLAQARLRTLGKSNWGPQEPLVREVRVWRRN